MIHLLFVAVCFLLDELLILLFPNTYLVDTLLFIPNLGFCAMILTVRKFDIVDTCLFSFGCGMIYDFCFANTFLVYAMIFMMVASLLHLWTKHLTDTIIESLILAMITIFVKDLLVYYYLDFQRIMNMDFMLYVERYELLTLLGNAILVMFIVFFIRLKDDYLERRARRIRKGEKIVWFEMKQKS